MKEKMLVNKKIKIYFISATCGDDVQLMIGFKKRLAGWYCYTNGVEMEGDWQLIFLDKAKDPEELLVNADAIFIDPVIAWRKKSLSSQLRELNRKREGSTLVVSLPKPVPKRRDFFADPEIFIKKFHQAVGESREEDTVELPKVKTELQTTDKITDNEDNEKEIKEVMEERKNFIAPQITRPVNVLVSLKKSAKETEELKALLEQVLTADSKVVVDWELRLKDLDQADILITDVRKRQIEEGNTEKIRELPCLAHVDLALEHNSALQVIVAHKRVTGHIKLYLRVLAGFIQVPVKSKDPEKMKEVVNSLQTVLWRVIKTLPEKFAEFKEGEVAVA